jgi:site-specific DNA-methyltransferase (adenine-specific)
MTYVQKVAIGGATLFQGDCMAVMCGMPDKSFDLAIVDPPYFDGPNKSGYYGKGYSSLGVQRAKHYADTKCWAVPDAEYFKELQRVSKHQIIWGANHFADRFNSASPAWIVWDKINGASSFADAELAYCSMAKAVRIFRYMWNGMHQGKCGGDMSKNEPRIHPTQKPVALYEWLLDNSTHTWAAAPAPWRPSIAASSTAASISMRTTLPVLLDVRKQPRLSPSCSQQQNPRLCS